MHQTHCDVGSKRAELVLNLLYLTPYLPWPLHRGPEIRVFHIVRELGELDHNVTLVAGSPDPEVRTPGIVAETVDRVRVYRTSSRGRTRSVVRSLFSPRPYPVDRALTKECRRTMRDSLHDGLSAVVVAHSHMLEVLPPSRELPAPVILDQHESVELFWRDLRDRWGGARGAFAAINLWKVRRRLPRWLARADAAMAVSPEETDFLRRRLEAPLDVWTVPNGVDPEYFRPPEYARRPPPRIMLCANYSVRRNVDAASWFAKALFPAIRSEVENAEFWIVGREPPKSLRALARNAGVEVTGMVEDVRPYYGDARVVVLPYRFGAGTRLKALEAMAMARPVVTTLNGCRGIDADDGEHVLVARTKKEFVARCVELLRSWDRGRKLGRRARARVRKKYAWSSIAARLAERLESVAKTR